MQANVIKWTPAMDAYLRKHWGESSMAKIGAHFKFSYHCIRRRAKKLGLPALDRGRTIQWTSEEDALLRKLWPSLTLPALAEHFDCTERTVRRRSKALGLSPKTEARQALMAERVPVEMLAEPEPDLPMTFAARAPARINARTDGNLMVQESEWKRKARQASASFEAAYRWAAAANGWAVREYRA